jgi:peptide/nickel transport system substrate-binding protein
LVEGFSTPDKRSDRVVLEANTNYWDRNRIPRIKRIVFDNTLSQHEAVEAVKTSEGRVDLVSELSPLETLPLAQSPFATVVKHRGTNSAVFGQLNMRKAGSPWKDVRVRQAANLAVNRTDVIRYGAKGNGVIVPALIPVQGAGYDPKLVPYPFDPVKARRLLREAGYPNGLPISLIAPEAFRVLATVVSKMLEQGGFDVSLQVLDATTFTQRTDLSQLAEPAEQQRWDVALTRYGEAEFPAFVYHWFALDGPYAWVTDAPDLRQLYDQVLRTVEPAKQDALIQQLEGHAHDRAYFLFLYQPIGLFAVNKAVRFVPYYGNGLLKFEETSVTDQHWSVRTGATKP